MRILNRVALGMSVAALSAFVFVACTDHATEITPAEVTTLPDLAQSGQCGWWACETYLCGYDTATDPRGACCKGPVEPGQSPQPKPSCVPDTEPGLCGMFPGLPSCSGAEFNECKAPKYCYRNANSPPCGTNGTDSTCTWYDFPECLATACGGY